MKQILLIMCNASLVQRVTSILEQGNYKVHLCSDVIRAVEMSEFVKPDLILCESALPVITGMQMSRLFKRHKKLLYIPFLLITVKMPSTKEMERSGFRIDADDIIQLPVTRWELLGSISDWVNPEKRPLSISHRMAGPLSVPKKSGQNRSWKKGAVNCVSLSRLLYYLADYKESGRLQVVNDSGKISAVFDNGLLIEVTSSYLPEETFGTFLEEHRKITRDERKDAFLLSKGGGSLLGSVLAEKDVLEKHELHYYLTQHKVRKLQSLFGSVWNRAAFEFTPEIIDKQSAAGMEAKAVPEILQKAIFTTIEPGKMEVAFTKNRKGDLPIFVDDRLKKNASLFDLNSAQVENMRAMNGKSLIQLKGQSEKSDQEMMRQLFFLIVTKSAHFKGELREERVPKTQLSEPPAEEKEEDLVNHRAPQERFSHWDVTAYNNAIKKAWTMIQNSQLRLAQPVLVNALKMNPDSSQALCMMGWVNYYLAKPGDIVAKAEAKDMLKKAITLDDHNDLAMLYLGKILRSEGKEGLAKTYFQQAYDINPAADDAQREVELMRIKNRKNSRYRME